MNFEGKIVIVTGGAAGIGLAAAKAFARSGANVLITGRRQDRLNEVTAQEPRIEGLVANAGDPQDAVRTITSAVERWGRLDVLVNNAGAGNPSPLVDASAERVQAVYAVNSIGPTLLASAAIPYLQKTRGAILNVSSSLGRKAVVGLADYAASKAALEHLTRCWALELAPLGIRVNAVASGPVESDFLRERMGYSKEEAEAIKTREASLIPLRRRGSPEDVARWIVALAYDEAEWVTGQILGVDGGFALV